MFTDAYNRILDAIIQDPLVHDDLLFQTAQNYLQVLTYPSFAHFNRPHWVARIIRFRQPIETVNEFTMGKLFDAMYSTTERHRLMKARRFVLATICACGQNIGVIVPGTLGDAPVVLEDKSKALAVELCRLGSLWVAYLLWPFLSGAQSHREERSVYGYRHITPVPPALRRSHSPIDEHYDLVEARGQVHLLKEDVRLLMRENRTCLFTGGVDPETAPLYLARILNINVALPDGSNADMGDETASKAITLDLFRRFCEIDDKDTEIMKDWFNPQNTLLLEWNTRYFFELFIWRLHSTDIPNTYKIVVRVREGVPPPVNERVTFVDRSANFDPVPP